MSQPYLEVTYRHGRPLAAYLYLPRQAGDKSHHTIKSSPGLLIDFHKDGRPIGIEITDPTKITLAALNRTLRELGVPAARKSDLLPLKAA